MTDFLLRLFVKDYRNTKDTKVRTCYGKLSGIVGIICNAVLFLGKLAAGSLSGSVSITADAFNNLSDASSSIISLFGFRLSERPPDKRTSVWSRSIRIYLRSCCRGTCNGDRSRAFQIEF